MVDVGKIIKVSGKCITCDKRVEATVTAVGEKGRTGDWKGTGICPGCDKDVYLEKKNISF